MPYIISNYTEKERYAKVKKVYSTIANALTRARADGVQMDYEVSNNSDENMRQWFDTYIAKYFITTKICYDAAGCWNKGDSKYMNGSNAYCNRAGVGIGYNIISFILNDGTYVIIDSYSKGSILSYFGVNIDTNDGLIFYFDINGEKKPNVIGRDIFAVVWTENGLVPAYKDKTASQKSSDCSPSGTGMSCINKYLKQ